MIRCKAAATARRGVKRAAAYKPSVRDVTERSFVKVLVIEDIGNPRNSYIVQDRSTPDGVCAAPRQHGGGERSPRSAVPGSAVSALLSGVVPTSTTSFGTPTQPREDADTERQSNPSPPSTVSHFPRTRLKGCAPIGLQVRASAPPAEYYWPDMCGGPDRQVGQSATTSSTTFEPTSSTLLTVSAKPPAVSPGAGSRCSSVVSLGLP